MKKTLGTITQGSTFNTKFTGEPEDKTTPIDTTAGPNQKRVGTNLIKKDKPIKKKLRNMKYPVYHLKGHILTNY